MILLSFDTEEFDVPREHGVDFPLDEAMKVSVYGTNRILDCLKNNGVKATFFCTSNFAENAPEVMRRIMDEGHEVAAHGCDHWQPQASDVSRSKEILERLTGRTIQGYRQPRMFPVSDTELERMGYVYNSSLNPAFIPGRYMHLSEPRTCFMTGKLLQIPASVTPWIRFPLFWLSCHNLPMWLYQLLVNRVLKHDGYFVTYFHPWEFYPLGAIVSPCYNEEEVLEDSAARLTALFDELVAKEKISADSFVLFVNDGSKDRTWSIIKKLHGTNPYIKGMNLARNVGHQYAIMAGMMTAKDWSDAVITIDADLQDDLNAIEEMVDAYMQGYDVVYGVKVSRQADPVLKRLSATAFYKLQHRMGVETIYNHADFRFLSRRVLEKLSHYQERNVYLRGIIPLLGFPSTTVDDVIRERTAGTSKYTVRKMFSLALDGITSFSVKPIYGIVYLGGIFVFISILIGIYVLYALISGTAEHGWASLMLSIWFVGGVVLLSIGAVGLYIGKIYKEVKRRPLYNVEEVLYDDQNK